MSRYIFFAKTEHLKFHLTFVRNLLGGEYVVTGKWHNDDNTYDLIKDKDGPDVIWFFAHLHENLLPHIKGKIIFLGHGLDFKPYLFGHETRKMLLKKYVDQIWSSGYCYEYQYLEAGIPKEKIFRIGYPLLFLIPDLPVDEKSIYISVGAFEELMPWYKMLEFMKSTKWELNTYVSIHPLIPDEHKQHFIGLCSERENLHLVNTQEDLLKVFSFCRAAIAGLSSTATPFLYFQKPVIFIKRRGRYLFFQWQRLRKRIRDPLFYKILSESTKFVEPKGLSTETILNAKVSQSAKKMFYETNWDRKKTEELIMDALAKVA